jgi:hypothetical protein
MIAEIRRKYATASRHLINRSDQANYNSEQENNPKAHLGKIDSYGNYLI